MTDKGEQNIGTQSRSFSRRDFLKVAGVGTGAVVVGGAILDIEAGNIVKETFVDILEDPQKTNAFLEATNYALLSRAREDAKEYNINLTPNPERTPMLDIIRTGVELYGKPVYSPYDMENVASSEKQSDILLAGIRGLDTSDITGHAMLKYILNPTSNDPDIYKVGNFMNSSRDDLMSLGAGSGSREMSAANQGILTYFGITIDFPNSGIVKRALSQSPDTSDIKAVGKLIRDEVIVPFEAIRHVSEKRASRISTAHLLSHYLGRSNGNLREAMLDTEIALRIWGRSDWETGNSMIAYEPREQKEICDRFSYLLDQYSILGRNFGADAAKVINSYDCKNKDLSVINRIGIYHPWAIIDKLFSDSQKTIKIQIIGGMLSLAYVDQGNLKVVIDFNALLELSKIDAYLRSFPASQK